MRASKPPFVVPLLFSLFLALSQSGLAQVPKDLAWQMLSEGVRDKDARTAGNRSSVFGIGPGR